MGAGRARVPTGIVSVATPVGHGLAGVAVAGAMGSAPWARHRLSRFVWFAVAVVSANAADLDFLPGLVVGDPVLFHHGLSHSLLFVGLWSGLAWLMARRTDFSPNRIAALAGASYATHLLLDAATADGRAPVGIPLLAPFSDRHTAFSWTPFRGIVHGNPGDSAATVLDNVLSLQNAWTVAIETFYLIPLAVACWILGRLLRERRTMEPADSAS